MLRAGTGALSRRGIYLLDLLQRLAVLPVLPFRLRVRLLNHLGARLDPTARIGASVSILGRGLVMGEGAFVNAGCLLEAAAEIVIGPRAHLGHRAVVLSTTHQIESERQRAGASRHLPVRIGAGAWIGAGAMILPGVTVGDGAVVAAGAVVVDDCEPRSLYAGVPARLVRRLTAGDTTG